MPRSANAQLAVDMYDALSARYGWDRATAWHGIARLLLSCDVWRHCDISPAGYNVDLWVATTSCEVLTGKLIVGANFFKVGDLGISEALQDMHS